MPRDCTRANRLHGSWPYFETVLNYFGFVEDMLCLQNVLGSSSGIFRQGWQTGVESKDWTWDFLHSYDWIKASTLMGTTHLQNWRGNRHNSYSIPVLIAGKEIPWWDSALLKQLQLGLFLQDDELFPPFLHSMPTDVILSLAMVRAILKANHTGFPLGQRGDFLCPSLNQPLSHSFSFITAAKESLEISAAS